LKTYRLKESIHVNAPLDRCFLLSTSVPIVQQTLQMTPVAGKTTGLVHEYDHVLWRGWKFGLPAWHESVITRYERPAFFQDTMARGLFSNFQHDHRFEDIDGRTLMIDIVRCSMPLGPIGSLVAKRVVIPHILDTMLKRFALIKRIAEGPDWERYVAEATPNPTPLLP